MQLPTMHSQPINILSSNSPTLVAAYPQSQIAQPLPRSTLLRPNGQSIMPEPFQPSTLFIRQPTTYTANNSSPFSVNQPTVLLCLDRRPNTYLTTSPSNPSQGIGAPQAINGIGPPHMGPTQFNIVNPLVGQPMNINNGLSGLPVSSVSIPIPLTPLVVNRPSAPPVSMNGIGLTSHNQTNNITLSPPQPVPSLPIPPLPIAPQPMDNMQTAQAAPAESANACIDRVCSSAVQMVQNLCLPAIPVSARDAFLGTLIQQLSALRSGGGGGPLVSGPTSSAPSSQFAVGLSSMFQNQNAPSVSSTNSGGQRSLVCPLSYCLAFW